VSRRGKNQAPSQLTCPIVRGEELHLSGKVGEEFLGKNTSFLTIRRRRKRGAMFISFIIDKEGKNQGRKNSLLHFNRRRKKKEKLAVFSYENAQGKKIEVHHREATHYEEGVEPSIREVWRSVVSLRIVRGGIVRKVMAAEKGKFTSITKGDLLKSPRKERKKKIDPEKLGGLLPPR